MRWLRAINSITVYSTFFFFLGLLIGMHWNHVKDFIYGQIKRLNIYNEMPDISDLKPLDDLDPKDCHYYEPNKENFDWCPVTKKDENYYDPPPDSTCRKCHHYIKE